MAHEDIRQKLLPRFRETTADRIEKISTEALPAEPGVTVIDGGGRTLMPGLIDNHWHTMLVRPPVTQLTTRAEAAA